MIKDENKGGHLNTDKLLVLELEVLHRQAFGQWKLA
jgi:hypothetical protein